jgi:hypothetical protein
VPRDEIVLSVNKPPSRTGNDGDVLDLSQLNPGDGFAEIETGVTSGADSNTWDEISVDRDGRVDSCDDNASNGQSVDHPGAAVCHSSQSSKN